MPMDLKTRRYFQLIQDLNQKKRQQLAENVKFVGDLPQQLSGQKQENKGLPPTKLQDYVQLTDEELKKRIEEREQMISPIEALIQQEKEDAEEDGWQPFPAPRSKM